MTAKYIVDTVPPSLPTVPVGVVDGDGGGFGVGVGFGFGSGGFDPHDDGGAWHLWSASSHHQPP